MTTGWYYLHENGDLIWKRETGETAADIRESDFAVAMWPFDGENRELAWNILVEAAAAGVSMERIQELAGKWGCNNDDAQHYADCVQAKLSMDGDQWCATCQDFENLQLSSAGFGSTALEAMADLAKTLGYKPSKMWGAGFKDLLK